MLRKTEKYKFLGKYKVNIMKKQEKIPYMISYVKGIASNRNMGKMATNARMKMMETIMIPSILYNAEVYPSYTGEEIRLLERMQGKILREMLEMPRDALTVEARIHYTKLMLYYHIINSDEDRIIRKIILQQRESPRRRGTWYYGVWELLDKYKVTENVEEVEKSSWKRIVKTNIRSITGIY